MIFPPCPDAPKLTFISRAAEQQQPDGRSYVMLSCSSHCYPPVSQYSWFKRVKDDPENRDTLMSSHQNFTVYSDTPGYYYCRTRNEMGERSSDSEPLFVEGEVLFFLFSFFWKAESVWPLAVFGSGCLTFNLSVL